MAQKKIEEWIREIEERPSSAPLIMNYIAGRLQELTARNEELLAEIIALQSGNRVEEYERRIAHLEYQLELLKRGMGANPEILDMQPEMSSGSGGSRDLHQNLILYSPDGRVLRFPVASQNLRQGQAIAVIANLPEFESELPRMLAVDSKEELLFLFTTGRIATLPLSSIQAEGNLSSPAQPDQPINISWQQGVFPVPPRTSESLACVLPISQLSLADFFVQVSRRGFLKKIRIGMADGILQNRYIGMGIHKPPDRTFELLLCKSTDRIALVSWEGSLAIQEIKDLPVSLGQVSRLSSTDHLVRVLTVDADKSIVVMTNVGKAVHLTKDRLQTADAVPSKGSALYSSRRKEEGVRVVDAVCVSEHDYYSALDRSGNLTVGSIDQLSGSGVLETKSEILAFCRLPGAGDKERTA